jgi:hypothetical protein
MPVTPAIGRLSQGDCEFKFSLGYIARPCLKKTKPKQTNKKPNKNKTPPAWY